jgi:hypothetical protein
MYCTVNIAFYSIHSHWRSIALGLAALLLAACAERRSGEPIAGVGVAIGPLRGT